MDEPWFLESVGTDGSRQRRALQPLPFGIGRGADNDLVVEGQGLSRLHARIAPAAAGGLELTDLGSTNGTFVNRARVEVACALRENDVIHFAHAEFRLGLGDAAAADDGAADGDERTRIVPAGRPLSGHFVPHEREFMELLRGHGLSGAAQPIVDATSGKLFAYELLGRCTHPELPASPMHLFRLAAMLDREAELSDAFRRWGVAEITPRLRGAKLFVNTHPKETFADDFMAALVALRAQPGAPDLVVEVHETAVMEVARMRDLAARLAEIGVAFAYDDFGAGQARLNELGDVPAHFVKFDMGLVRGLHEASDRKQRVVRDLVRLVLDLGSVPLAEGVELEAEAAICRDMGFRLVQGYLTGRPMPLSAIAPGSGAG